MHGSLFNLNMIYIYKYPFEVVMGEINCNSTFCGLFDVFLDNIVDSFNCFSKFNFLLGV